MKQMCCWLLRLLQELVGWQGKKCVVHNPFKDPPETITHSTYADFFNEPITDGALDLHILAPAEPPKDLGEPIMAVEEKCIKQNVGGEKHYLLYEHEGDVTAIGPFIYLDNAKIWRAGFEWDRDDDIKIIGIVSNLIQSEQITVRAPLGVS